MTKTKQDLTRLDETGERKTDRRKKKTKAEAEASTPVLERRKELAIEHGDLIEHEHLRRAPAMHGG